MKYISIDEAVAAASSIIKNNSKEDRLIYKFWIWQAEKVIGCSFLSEDTCELIVQDLSATKPLDHVYTIDLALIDSKGGDVKYNYNGYRKRIHPITTLNNPSFIDVYESEDCIHLDSNGTSIEKVILRYYSYPVDENGDPKIPDFHLNAIMAYVRFMHNMRNDLPYDRDELRWKIQASKARGKNKMPNMAEGREIIDNWLTLLPLGTTTKYNSY